MGRRSRSGDRRYAGKEWRTERGRERCQIKIHEIRLGRQWRIGAIMNSIMGINPLD